MTKSPYDSLKWRCIGPFRGGRSVAVSADPTDITTFYMGTTGGGVWKSTDGGQYWINVSDGFFKRASVGGLAVSPSDPNVIYCGMGESTIRGNVSHGDGVYKSTDAGKSWTHVGLEATRNIAKVRVHPTNPDLVYVAAFGHAHGPNPERGIYRSQDGGARWDLVLKRNEDAGAIDLSIDARNPRLLYAALWEARRGPHYLSSGGPGSGLFKSTDGGDTWTELSDKPGMPKGLKGKIGVVASPAQSGRVWAIVENEDGGVFRSDNGGDSWERASDDRRLRQRAWYYSHIYADPQDANTVWVLNVETFRSVDAGKTFEVVPAPHGDNHDLWIDPANPLRMILGNDGGGTVSYNGGRSWTSQYTQPTAEFYHVTTDGRRPYRVYGSQQDNTSISAPSRSNHGLITRTQWHDIGGGEAGYIQVRPDNSDIVYAGEYQGYMTRYDHAAGQARSISVWPEETSGSGGKDYKYRFQWTYPILLSPHDPNTLYCGGNHVFRTRDEGSTWDAISPDLTRNDPEKNEPSGGPITKDNTGAEIYGTVFALAESPLQRGVLWVGSDDGLIHVSRDGGESWTNATPPTLPDWSLISLIEASPHDAATAYVAANRYKLDDFQPYLFKTNDYGATWTSIAAGIPDGDFCRAIREDPEQIGLLYVGSETGVHLSGDDGATWTRLGGNVPVVPVHDLVVEGDDLVLGTHGRAFWILDDVTLLRQLAQGDASSTAPRLFRPKDSYRYGRMINFGHEPVPGQNYTFAATQVPAFIVTKNPDGETETLQLEAGENPPEGVIVNYILPAEPDEPQRLIFAKADGTVVRTILSKPKDEEKKDETVFPPKAEGEKPEDKEPKAPAKAGLNRFVWDTRSEPSAKIETKGGHQPGRDGPRAVPGDFQVTLETGGGAVSQSFPIIQDPRQSSTQADLENQFTLLSGIRDKHDELNKAVNKIRLIRDQATDWARRVEGAKAESQVVAAAKTLSERLDKVEGALLQVKIKSDQDSLNYPVKLNAKLSALASMVESADAAPTRQAGELCTNLAALVDHELADLSRILATELPAFNAAVKSADVAAIVEPEVHSTVG